MLLVIVVNPLKKPPAPFPPKKSKAPPPLPPPKPISEERIRHEENNMYEEISGDEGDNEYTTLSDVPPEPEGGVLRYDYADMDRGVRPMSHHDEYGGSGGSTTGASGSGAFQSNDSGSDDDEYIESVTVTPMIVPQKTNQRNQYLNTLDGKDLGCPRQPEMKSLTLPHRSASYKDKGRKPLSPPPSSKPNPSHSFGGNSNNSGEFFSKLNQRRQQVERNTEEDDVFVKELTPKAFSKPGYQVCVLMNPQELSIIDYELCLHYRTQQD